MGDGMELWIIFFNTSLWKIQRVVLSNQMHLKLEIYPMSTVTINFKDLGNCEPQTKQGEIQDCQLNSQILSCALM